MTDARFEGSRVGSEVVLRFSGQMQNLTLTFQTPAEAETFAASVTHLCRAHGDDEVDVQCRLRVLLQSRKLKPRNT